MAQPRRPSARDLAKVEQDDAIHVEDAGAALTSDQIEELDPAAGPDGELIAAIDAFAEAFNARDLDGLLELFADDAETPGLGGDRDGAGEAVEDLWDRRPSCLLTRGEHEGEPLAVMWELDTSNWWRVATVHLDDVRDGAIGVVEFCDDAYVLEAASADVPDLDVDEGLRWEEWDEGVPTEG